MTGLEYEFSFMNEHIPIFFFIPSLIGEYLSFFYEQKDFKIQNFDLQNHKEIYFFNYRNQTERLQEISKALRNVVDMKKYIQILYEFLDSLEFEDVESCYII